MKCFIIKNGFTIDSCIIDKVSGWEYPFPHDEVIPEIDYDPSLYPSYKDFYSIAEDGCTIVDKRADKGFKNVPKFDVSKYDLVNFELVEKPESVAEQQKEDIHTKLSAIYEGATLLQQAQYKPVREAVQKYLESGEFDKIEALLLEAKNNLEPDVQPIAEAIYNKYMEMMK